MTKEFVRLCLSPDRTWHKVNDPKIGLKCGWQKRMFRLFYQTVIHFLKVKIFRNQRSISIYINIALTPNFVSYCSGGLEYVECIPCGGVRPDLKRACPKYEINNQWIFHFYHKVKIKKKKNGQISGLSQRSEKMVETEGEGDGDRKSSWCYRNSFKESELDDLKIDMMSVLYPFIAITPRPTLTLIYWTC